MRCLLFFSLCCCCFLAVAQQRDSIDLPKPGTENRWRLTFSPLALLHIDYTVQSGAEYTLNNQLRVVADVGYIFSSSYLERGEPMREASGFIFRPGIKYFPSPAGSFYLQPQFFYKQVTHHLYDWLDKDVSNGVGSYQQLQDFRYRRSVVGANFIVGTTFEIGRSGKLFADFYLGFGVRHKTYSLVDEKNSRYNNTGFSVFGRGGQRDVLPSLPIGLRLAYQL